MTQTVNLVDRLGNLVATAQVTPDGAAFAGPVDLQPMPRSMRAKFEEFETIVNGQTFSVLDRIENEIAGLGIKAVFANGEVELTDLQVYPSESVLSFRLKQPAASVPSAAASAPAGIHDPLVQENRI